MASERKLAAIMFTDIVGYTALMGSDEAKAFQVLHKNRDLHKPLIKKYNGKWLKEMGDGILASFDTASDAVRCAMEIQQLVKKEGIELRIGIHSGEVVFEGGDVLGDGVNVASRLEEIALKGSINVSGVVYKDVKNKPDIEAEYIEERSLKNVDEPVKVYRILYNDIADDQRSPDDEKLRKVKIKPVYYLLAFLVLIIISFIVWQFIIRENQTQITDKVETLEQEKSIAVLPFRNDSPDQENEYLCNGMLEEILTHLQKVNELRVKSRTTSELYRHQDKDIIEIAKELSVAYVLEGSIRKAGDYIRITAQLIDGKNGDHLWAETYDGDYTSEIFDFQTNVAKKITASLNAAITPEEEKQINKKATNEIMAFDLLWRGMDMIDNYTSTSDITFFEKGNALFDKALSIDPEYSTAYFAKGHALKMRADKTSGNYDSAMMYADRAIELDPEDMSGYGLKADIYVKLGMPDQAIEYYQKALELEPNWNWTNLLLGNTYIYAKKDLKKGLPYVNKAIKVDGRAQFSMYNTIGWLFLHMGDYDRAKFYFKMSLDLRQECNNCFLGYFLSVHSQGDYDETKNFLDSNCTTMSTRREQDCHRFHFYLHHIHRNYEQAEKYYQQYIESGGNPDRGDSIWLAHVYLNLGRTEVSGDILNNVLISFQNQLPQNHNWYYYLSYSQACSLNGEKEEALKSLNKVADSGRSGGWHDLLPIDPIFEDLRDDPEFQAIVKSMQDEKAAQRAIVREMNESGEIDL